MAQMKRLNAPKAQATRETFAVGDELQITKPGSRIGQKAVVTDNNCDGGGLLEVLVNGDVCSYKRSEVKKWKAEDLSTAVAKAPDIEGGLRGKFGAEKRGAGATVSPNPIHIPHIYYHRSYFLPKGRHI
jgi:hypothetical protein